MKLRPPAVPLITVSPYLSVWSPSQKLTDCDTMHWSGAPNTIKGTAAIDGKTYRFMGLGEEPPMQQLSLDIDAAETVYTFKADGVLLTASFFTPQIIDDPLWMSRPVSFLNTSVTFEDGKPHDIQICITVSEELCIETVNSHRVIVEKQEGFSLPIIKMGAEEQNPLYRSGDACLIDWGHFYLAASGTGGECKRAFLQNRTAVSATLNITSQDGLFIFGYDDINSFIYFGERINALWRTTGETLESVLEISEKAYKSLLVKARAFSKKMYDNADKCGGKKYAEMLMLAYRQVMGSHKLALDKENNIIYVSKECYSGGFGCTVDVTYPAVFMYLLYNPVLIEGMLTPIFKYARSAEWQYDFAPHDAGVYPILNGQRYSMDAENNLLFQMPVEECGNMLIICYAMAREAGNTEYIKENFDLLELWANYLLEQGVDPQKQLCTDDFAGHLAHNCNLSLKAITALYCMGELCRMVGRDGTLYQKAALAMAEDWESLASNGDGSYRLAFDKPNSFSLKYNLVWDKLFSFGIFPTELMTSEFKSLSRHKNRYGVPLDSRADYTKADWLLWVACFANSKAEFEEFISPLWDFYNETPDRVPMTDWYDSKTGRRKGFQNRTVLGGLFIKLYESLKG